MKSGPFNTFLAQTCAVDEKTVAVYTRFLKEAGLMTAGQGRYAPHMLPIDAARALIALMATDRPSEAVTVVQRWQAMRPRPELSNGDGQVGILADLLAGLQVFLVGFGVRLGVTFIVEVNK